MVPELKRVTMKEKNIVKQIQEYLKTKENIYFWKNHGNQYSKIGLPDIMVVEKGKLYAFEVKTDKGKPTEKQIYEIELLRKAGAVAEIVRSKEEVQKILEGDDK